MICESCDQEVGQDINVFESPDGPLGEGLLGIIVVCPPCGQEIIQLLRAKGIVLDPLTGDLSDPTKPVRGDNDTSGRH